MIHHGTDECMKKRAIVQVILDRVLDLGEYHIQVGKDEAKRLRADFYQVGRGVLDSFPVRVRSRLTPTGLCFYVRPTELVAYRESLKARAS